MNRTRITGKHRFSMIVLAVMFALSFGAGQAQAAVIQLFSYGEMTPGFLLNDFETTKNKAWVTFDPSAFLVSCAAASEGVCPSPIQGLAEFIADEPLGAMLTSPATEVGVTFGNDDFGLVFNALLSIFSPGDVFLGQVMVLSNGNDFADQFIGLRSTIPFTRVDIAYQRPQAQGLAVFVDDFAVNAAAVPEPATLLLLGTGLAAVGVRRSRLKK